VFRLVRQEFQVFVLVIAIMGRGPWLRPSRRSIASATTSSTINEELAVRVKRRGCALVAEHLLKGPSA
jgi:hypothetical protein